MLKLLFQQHASQGAEQVITVLRDPILHQISLQL